VNGLARFVETGASRSGTVDTFTARPSRRSEHAATRDPGGLLTANLDLVWPVPNDWLRPHLGDGNRASQPESLPACISRDNDTRDNEPTDTASTRAYTTAVLDPLTAVAAAVIAVLIYLAIRKWGRPDPWL